MKEIIITTKNIDSFISKLKKKLEKKPKAEGFLIYDGKWFYDIKSFKKYIIN